MSLEDMKPGTKVPITDTLQAFVFRCFDCCESVIVPFTRIKGFFKNLEALSEGGKVITLVCASCESKGLS